MADSLPVLGSNDEDHVYCALCNWSKPIYSFEQAELLLKDHLKIKHGKNLIYATEKESGKIKPCP